MIERLRQLLVALAATAAVASTTVVLAAPADASGGDTCMDPHLTGTFTKGSHTTPNGLTVAVVKFNAVGYTSANCPGTYVDYRYRAAFTYNGQTTSAYHSEIEPVYGYRSGAFVRMGTRIRFPEQRLNFTGYKDVVLAVTSGSKSAFTSTWCRSNEETSEYLLTWPPSTTTVAFDTADREGVPRARVNACP